MEKAQYLITCFDCKYCSAEDPLTNKSVCSQTRRTTYYTSQPCNLFKIRYTEIKEVK